MHQISADSPTDAWAIVGVEVSDVVLDHWDGTDWTPVRVAIPPGAFFEGGISADAPNDAWIVGGRSDDTGLAYHWNGSVWSSVALPNSQVLRGVSAVAPEDVWVVTVTQHIEHWNGTAWRVVHQVSPPGAYVGIAAFSHSDVFLLGDRRFVSRWHAHQWVTTTFPLTGWIAQIAGSSPTNVWIAGWRYVNPTDPQPFAAHFDGTSWTEESPTDLSKWAIAFGVATSSPTSAWIVGRYGKYGLVEHWDGAAWTWIRHPQGELDQVAVVPESNMAWATGATIDRYC